MKTISETLQTPIVAEYDVIVVGGGPAGFAAAVCAAREGAKTCIIEQCGGIGGVATSGLMSHWTGNTQGGFYEEILQRSAEKPELRQTIHPEKLHGVMLEMLLEAGVEVRLYTFAVAPVMDENKIIGVVIESKSGRQALMGKVVIDASGDGDIAARSGAEYQLGREGDGVMQPMTLMFKVGGVDYDRAIFPGSFESLVDVPAGEIQSLARANLPAPAGHVLLYKSTLPGVVTCNMTNVINVDGTKSEDLTKAQLTCRKQIPLIIDFLRKYAPGYENCYLHSAAAQIGVRETRHFKGLYTLTEDDIMEMSRSVLYGKRGGQYIADALKDSVMVVENKRLKTALIQLGNDLDSGRSLDDCLQELEMSFSNGEISSFCTVIKSLQSTGQVDEALRTLENNIEREQVSVNKRRCVVLEQKTTLYVILIAMDILGMLLYCIIMKLMDMQLGF